MTGLRKEVEQTIVAALQQAEAAPVIDLRSLAPLDLPTIATSVAPARC